MKKLSFFAFLAIALMTLTSCTDDSKLIIGKWVSTADSYVRIINSYSDETRNREEGAETWVISEDGNVTITIVSTRTWPYTFADGKLNIGGDDWDVLKLTKKTLVVQREYSTSGEREIEHIEFVKK